MINFHDNHYHHCNQLNHLYWLTKQFIHLKFVSHFIRPNFSIFFTPFPQMIWFFSPLHKKMNEKRKQIKIDWKIQRKWLNHENTWWRYSGEKKRRLLPSEARNFSFKKKYYWWIIKKIRLVSFWNLNVEEKDLIIIIISIEIWSWFFSFQPRQE